MLDDADNHAPAFDSPDPDEVYANYLRTCAMLNVEPLPRERARELVGEWSRVMNAAMRREYGPQRAHRRAKLVDAVRAGDDDGNRKRRKCP